jgi:hypothetical protein
LVTEKFISILKNSATLQQEETHALKNLIEKYPYFQSARCLYLKGLKSQDSFKYNNELKVTAAYTTDRTILFDFITGTAFTTPQQPVAQQHLEEQALIEAPAGKETEDKTAVHKPLSFSTSEKHSFIEWLQLASATPIVRAPVEKETPISKASIIDRFIEKKAKIKPGIKGKAIAVSVSKNEASNALMTETLAKVYLAQKKYENAIQAYKILSLKYPEKSGFFADQIKRIQILQKNIS